MGMMARQRITSLIPADPVRHFCDLLMRAGRGRVDAA
jgi:hypothetical protein